MLPKSQFQGHSSRLRSPTFGGFCHTQLPHLSRGPPLLIWHHFGQLWAKMAKNRIWTVLGAFLLKPPRHNLDGHMVVVEQTAWESLGTNWH